MGVVTINKQEKPMQLLILLCFHIKNQKQTALFTKATETNRNDQLCLQKPTERNSFFLNKTNRNRQKITSLFAKPT